MKLCPLLPSLLGLLTIAALGTACSSTDSATGQSVTVTTTAISIDPQDFLGETLCSGEEGALRSYVVTVIDQTDPLKSAILPSSPPSACSQGVAFRYIIPDHSYTVEIDGYEALAGSIKPAGGIASGSRHMVVAGPDGGAEALPRWTSVCKPVKAELHTNVTFKECDKLEDHGSSAPASITLDPLSALGDLRCAGAGGEVASFDITPKGSALPLIKGIPCGGAPIKYSAGIEPGELYTFRLEARAEAGGPVVWGASCFVLPEEGLVNGAVCDPLTSTGAIDLSIGALLKASGAACGKDVSSFRASLAKPELTSGPVACDDSARFAPLAPGEYSIAVDAFDPDDAKVLSATCSATVIPGETAQATCQ